LLAEAGADTNAVSVSFTMNGELADKIGMFQACTCLKQKQNFVILERRSNELGQVLLINKK